MALPQSYKDAYLAQLIEGKDAFNEILIADASEALRRKKADTDLYRMKVMQELQRLIKEAKEHEEDGIVVNGYRKMLTAYSES